MLTQHYTYSNTPATKIVFAQHSCTILPCTRLVTLGEFSVFLTDSNGIRKRMLNSVLLLLTVKPHILNRSSSALLQVQLYRKFSCKKYNSFVGTRCAALFAYIDNLLVVI